MARKKHLPESAGETLDQIESRGDQIVEWVSTNPMLVMGTALALLVVAGAWGLTRSSMESSRNESAAALSRIQGDYRVAMGATPGTVEIPEPANPETARTVRTEYLEKYLEMAGDYEGSVAAALALLEAGRIQRALGEGDGAIETFERAVGQLDEASPVRALLQASIGATHEAAGRWSQAAEAYEAAASVANYPLRYEALADASRSYAHAGNDAKAIEIYAAIESEAPDYRIPPYLEARIGELRGNAVN